MAPSPSAVRRSGGPGQDPGTGSPRPPVGAPATAPGGPPEPPLARSEEDRTTRSALVRALSEGDPTAAESAARLLLASGTTPQELLDGLLRPLLVRLGDGWAAGTVSVEQEHTVSAAVQVLLHRLAPEHRADGGGRGTVVLAGVPGEQHLLGLAMLRDALVRTGWRVSLPGELPAPELERHVQRCGEELRLIGLSAHSAQRRRALRAQVNALRAAAPRVPVLLGGQAVAHDPDLPAAVGADGGAADLPSALRLVEDLTNPLTPREREVLLLVADGLSNAEVALAAGISPGTVKTHLERVYAKVGTGDRAAAVAQALRAGWIA